MKSIVLSLQSVTRWTEKKFCHFRDYLKRTSPSLLSMRLTGFLHFYFNLLKFRMKKKFNFYMYNSKEVFYLNIHTHILLINWITVSNSKGWLFPFKIITKQHVNTVNLSLIWNLRLYSVRCFLWYLSEESVVESHQGVTIVLINTQGFPLSWAGGLATSEHLCVR